MIFYHLYKVIKDHLASLHLYIDDKRSYYKLCLEVAKDHHNLKSFHPLKIILTINYSVQIADRFYLRSSSHLIISGHITNEMRHTYNLCEILIISNH
jgi:hypothetical protein